MGTTDFVKSDKKQYNSIMSALRRCWARSPKRVAVLNKALHPTAKGPRGGARRICGVCGESFGTPELSVDHIDPVVPLHLSASEMTWDTIIDRMFNSAEENLQPVCKKCHDLKTKEENKQRKHYRDLKNTTKENKHAK